MNLAKKVETNILSARDTTRPGFQAGALWVESKGSVKRLLFSFSFSAHIHRTIVKSL